MAWTTPRTWTTTELVTAAHMNTHVRDNLNFLASWESAGGTQTASGFTNTAYADLDALTAAPFASAVIVTVVTGTTVLITPAANAITQATAGTCFLAYRVSGATTIASSDNRSARSTFPGIATTSSYPHILEVLTPGTNTFELQARVTANSAVMLNPTLTIVPQA